MEISKSASLIFIPYKIVISIKTIEDHIDFCRFLNDCDSGGQGESGEEIYFQVLEALKKIIDDKTGQIIEIPKK